MNINRNNYEEYFLMYVDNELTAADRSAVDRFIEANTDLKAELEILQQTVLQPEPLSFDKSSLFAIASKGINKENHEEYFIEYVNNELSRADREATETFVLQHPELQESFTSFKETILPNEIIEFKNKEILYRKEDARVIAFSFQRLAVAAAVLGIIAIGMWFYPSNEKDQPTAKTEIKKNDAVRVQQPTNTNTNSINSPESVKENNASVIDIKQQETQTANADNNILADASVTKQIDDRSAIITPEEKTEIPVAYSKGEIITNEKSNSGNAGTIDTEKLPNISLSNNEPQTSVAYTALETEESDNNVYVGALSINKDKLKGAFRKATRLFSSKAKNENEDGKLQIANLEIDTRKNK